MLLRTILIYCIAFLSSTSVLHAQNADDYKGELGGALGGSFYMGDANYTTPFKDLGVVGGVIGRYTLNPHMAIKTNLLMARIAGDTRHSQNKYPELRDVDFKRQLVDLGAQFEYNFLAYGIEKGFRKQNRFTPYVLAGMGFTYALPPDNALFTLNFPIGLGVKYKLNKRLNIGCEFTMRFTVSDKLDVTHKSDLQLNNPYEIKGKGLKNKDSYSFTLLYITYDLFPKCKECNY